MARHHDGRLVCGHRFWKQADTNRPTLGRLASFSVLAFLQRVCVGDGLRSLDSIKAFEESDAGNLKLSFAQLQIELRSLYFDLCLYSAR